MKISEIEKMLHIVKVTRQYHIDLFKYYTNFQLEAYNHIDHIINYNFVISNLKKLLREQ